MMRYQLKNNLAMLEAFFRLDLQSESGSVAYHNEDEFLADLHLIHTSLVDKGDIAIAAAELTDLIRLVNLWFLFIQPGHPSEVFTPHGCSSRNTRFNRASSSFFTIRRSRASGTVK